MGMKRESRSGERMDILDVPVGNLCPSLGCNSLVLYHQVYEDESDNYYTQPSNSIYINLGTKLTKSIIEYQLRTTN